MLGRRQFIKLSAFGAASIAAHAAYSMADNLARFGSRIPGTGAGMPPQSNGSAVSHKVSGYRTLWDFGAKGGGADDTKALLSAAASGENIWIDGNFVYQDTLLKLANGQTWAGVGVLTQKSVAVSNIPSDSSGHYPPSNYPAFLLNSEGAAIKGFSVIAAWEGVQMAAPNTRVQAMKLCGQDVNYYDGVLAYANDVEIVENHIVRFGKWMTGASYAKRGEGIFLSNGAVFNKKAKVLDNTVMLNAKNGLLVIGYQSVVAKKNTVIANRMSAFQIAFLSGLAENNAKDILIEGNVGWNNGADCFDANNNTGSGVVYDLNTTVASNDFRRNGWVYNTREEQLRQVGEGLSTADGGSATLINVAGVNYSNNRIVDSNRNCGYLSNVDRISLEGNEYFKSTRTRLDDADGFRLANARHCRVIGNVAIVPRTQYRIEGDCRGTEISNNTISSTEDAVSAIVTPAGAEGFSFENNTVRIKSGSFIPNGNWRHSGCKFEIGVSQGILDRKTFP